MYKCFSKLCQQNYTSVFFQKIYCSVGVLVKLSKATASKKNIWAKDPSSKTSALPDRVKMKCIYIFLKKEGN